MTEPNMDEGRRREVILWNKFVPLKAKKTSSLKALKEKVKKVSIILTSWKEKKINSSEWEIGKPFVRRKNERKRFLKKKSITS
jgi:hypothetical protein